MAVGRLLSNQTNYKFTSFSPHKIPYFSNILYIFTRESLAGTWSPKTQAQAVYERVWYSRPNYLYNPLQWPDKSINTINYI